MSISVICEHSLIISYLYAVDRLSSESCAEPRANINDPGEARRHARASPTRNTPEQVLPPAAFPHEDDS